MGLNLARFAFYHMGVAQVKRAWDAVFQFMQTFTQWPNYLPNEDFELDETNWAFVAARVISFIPWRMGKSVGGMSSPLDCYIQWYQEPMPDPLPILAFEDVCLMHKNTSESRSHFETIKKAHTNNCHVYLPVSVKYRPSQQLRDRMTTALNQAYAGNPRGKFKIMIAESLGLLGLCHSQRCNFIKGTWGEFEVYAV